MWVCTTSCRNDLVSRRLHLASWNPIRNYEKMKFSKWGGSTFTQKRYGSVKGRYIISKHWEYQRYRNVYVKRIREDGWERDRERGGRKNTPDRRKCWAGGLLSPSSGNSLRNYEKWRIPKLSGGKREGLGGKKDGEWKRRVEGDEKRAKRRDWRRRDDALRTRAYLNKSMNVKDSQDLPVIVLPSDEVVLVSENILKEAESS